MNKNQQEMELFKFIERVRDEADNCIIRGQSASDYQQTISDMCIECFKCKEDLEDCEKCNKLQDETNWQLYLEFDAIK